MNTKTLGEKQKYLYDAFLHRANTVKTVNWLPYSTIFMSIHGSTSYGLDTELSDVDMAGVCVPPKKYWHGFVDNFEQAQFSKPDGQIYGLKKFFVLAVANNPNVMELLWIDPKYWVIYTKTWNDIIEYRDLFLSKKVRWSYAGYAVAQLKRIKTHRKWLLNPPTHRPTRDEFKLPEHRVIRRDDQGALERLIVDKGYEINENFMAILQRENAYDRAVKEYEQYETWKKNRNPARAELEAKFGYDTKHAAQLVRLILQAKEILLNGTLHVDRRDIDREEIMKVKRGGWTYDQLIDWVRDYTEEDILIDSEQKNIMDKWSEESKLPNTPNINKLNEIFMNVVDRYVNANP